ncbi:MAG: polyphenol oxidase family protein [Planctomycetota bacterium]
MIARERRGVRVLVFEKIDRAGGLVHFLTTRVRRSADGKEEEFTLDPSRERDRRFLAELPGLGAAPVFSPEQVHGDRIAEVNSATSPAIQREADGVLTREAGVILCVKGADCPLALLYDPDAPALCLFHSGWRGTVKHIARQAVAAMRQQGGGEPLRMLAGLGPSIQSCCYEVGREVERRFAAEFPSEIIERRAGRTFIRLEEAIRLDLQASGIPPEGIERSGLCTRCHPELFHSYRRQGPSAGRMILAAALLP